MSINNLTGGGGISNGNSLLLRRRMMMRGMGEQVKVVWDYPSLGYLGSCELYAPYALTKADWILGVTPAIFSNAFTSGTDALVGGPTYDIRGNFGWRTGAPADSTILIPYTKMPRYIAWLSFGGISDVSFPVAHIGRCYQSEPTKPNTHLFGTNKALRNISSEIKHIYDLQTLFEEYGADDRTIWTLNLRVGYGKIVGSNDLNALQSYLNSLP